MEKYLPFLQILVSLIMIALATFVGELVKAHEEQRKVWLAVLALRTGECTMGLCQLLFGRHLGKQIRVPQTIGVGFLPCLRCCVRLFDGACIAHSKNRTTTLPHNVR